MLKQTKWFDRTFEFNNDQNIFPSLMERLSGTPLRLEAKIDIIRPDLLVFKMDGAWSIKENIGHMNDLETLWQGRFEDIKNGALELRATDLSNSKTDLANHNKTEIADLLMLFKKLREQTLAMLKDIDENLIFKSALHPRLKTPMSTMDLFNFVAEHDDHHLARITEITNSRLKR